MFSSAHMTDVIPLPASSTAKNIFLVLRLTIVGALSAFLVAALPLWMIWAFIWIAQI
jgi:hypothetical protein